MYKQTHEFRDPIHNFIYVHNSERKIIDSKPFQRLRHIHQLALTYLVYPGASHKRFEHSLGVVELATRVYKVITDSENIYQHDSVKKIIPTKSDHDYWLNVLRISALCHDIGHLPFSHAAEDELLPSGYDHEKITEEIILNSDLTKIITKETTVRPEQVAKIAVGPKKYKKEQFSVWETILSEIITGNSFGVDRIDYLLRDSHHLGVAYGKFDHYRLIDSLRILPKSEGANQEKSYEPALGIMEGGIQSVEALLLARYLMFSQVYYHHVRRAYDIHLKDFLKKWLANGYFSVNLNDFLDLTDNEINNALYKIAFDPDHKANLEANRIICRDHFKFIYQKDSNDIKHHPDPSRIVFENLSKQYGADNVRRDNIKPKPFLDTFPVLTKEEKIISSIEKSEALLKIPPASFDYVFINSVYLEQARDWLSKNKNNFLLENEGV